MRTKTMGMLTLGIMTMAALTGCAGEATPGETSTTTPTETSAPQGAETEAAETDAAETDAAEAQAPETSAPEESLSGSFVMPSCAELVDAAALAEELPEAVEQEPPTVDEFLTVIGASDATGGTACLWELPSKDGGLGLVAVELVDPAEALAAQESFAPTTDGWTDTSEYSGATGRTISEGGATGTFLVNGSVILYLFSTGSTEAHAEFVTHAYDAILNGSD